MSLNIVFMGTPDFAKTCLEGITDKHNIKAVFTQVDKPQGRKMIMTPPPVKVFAVENNIPVYQPLKLKSDEINNIIEDLNPDVIVVAAYGKILPKAILDIPKYGCVNVHGSILPKYRGASPIQTSILNGDKVTGVTTMYMDEGMDTGDIILVDEMPIANDDTSETLYPKLAELGQKLLIKTLDLIEQGKAPREKQTGEPTFCKMFKKEDGNIDWNKSANEIHNLVRAFNPWPTAYTDFDGKMYKIWKTEAIDDKTNAPKQIILQSKDELQIGTGSGIIKVLEIQSEGKKKMAIQDFLRGNKLV